MTAPKSDFHENATGSSTFSYRFAAFQLPEASDDLGVDDRDRTFTAAATLGAIEANLVCLVVIVFHYAFSGPVDRPHGFVGSLIAALLEVLIVILLCVVPLSVVGAVVGMLVNLFLQRSKWWFHGMSVAMLAVVFHSILVALAGLD